jgi:lipopolysaccharide/colanic/teichoic acid biosynthesis glycosyltransferase
VSPMSRRVALVIKRLIDVLVSAIGLAALSPLLVVLVALELLYHGWPPFFVQRRPGLDGRIFSLLKFRSMTNARGPDGALLADAERLTPFGRWLRSTSLDELPELIHVLTGQMSLVGPRPLLPEYLDLYTPEQARRHEMRPGITGPCAVQGRNRLSWDEKFRLDVEYIDNWSLALDLKILWRTVEVVLRREGISAEGDETMPRFTGTSRPPPASP